MAKASVTLNKYRRKIKIMRSKNASLISTIELGQAIKRRREELNLSLRDVGDLTDVSASTLSRIENGTGRPDADNIARLTQWLDIPVDRLMTKHLTGNVEPVIYYPHEKTTDISSAGGQKSDTRDGKGSFRTFPCRI
jgi:transcriptional regulator with XRE-family HTH domain